MTVATRRSPLTCRQEVELLDGSRIFLRPICSQDKQALQAFHCRLSPDSRFFRYQYLKGDLTEDDLKNFCDVDYDRDMALVAERGTGNDREIIGVGRYYRLDDPCKAEVAFVVQDSEQGKGVGTQLLVHLAMIAYHQGILYFTGEVLRNNCKMLSLFRKSDPGMGYAADGGSTCTVNLSVTEIISQLFVLICLIRPDQA